jgi:molybdopterin-guanine dinucleotide biosynthesis protein A
VSWNCAEGGPSDRAAAVVLAGGASRRWGGRDKTAADLRGLPVLGHVVEALPDGMTVIVVGPPDHPFAAVSGACVHWTREDPPGGGPAAGLAAGLAALPESVDVVVVLAGDLPLSGTAVPRLLSALGSSSADAVIGVDQGGRRQPLLAVYRVTPLRAALLAPGVDPAGRALRSVLAGLTVDVLAVSDREAQDLDTPEDLAAVRRRLARSGPDRSP